MLSADKSRCISTSSQSRRLTSSNQVYSSLNTDSSFGPLPFDVFDNGPDSFCEDLVQVNGQGQCNLCGLGFYLDSAGFCRSNPTPQCWVESTRSYTHFGEVFDQSDSPQVFSAKRVQFLERDSEQSKAEKGRILEDQIRTGSFCFLCRPGYHQTATGICV